MIGKLILTHGGLAKELLAAAQKISGELPGFAALSLDWDVSLETARENVVAALASLDQGEGVLILTDMFGGTPCNVAAALMDYGRVEMLTGVNLPMLVRALTYRDKGLAVMVEKALSGGTEGVLHMTRDCCNGKH